MVHLAILFLLGQGGDARLAVRASLERPRVTFAEFGAWVQNRTGVAVSVATAIRGRSATVLVADRPVGETMARFAGTFSLEWERTATGLRLRLPAKVAAEEATFLEAVERGRAAALRESVEALMALSALTSEEIEARFGDPATESILLSRYGQDPAALAAGAVLRGLSPAERERVMAGGRAFGSDRPGPGMVRLDPHWGIDLAKRLGSMGPPTGDETLVEEKPAAGVFAFLKGDPAGGGIVVSVSAQDADGEALTTQIEKIGDDALPPPDGPLDHRLAAWARPDDPLLDAPLKADPLPLANHPSGRHTLADLLVSLHRRSGLPIVADGFREAAWGAGAPDGKNARDWLGALRSGVSTPRYLVRASDGWLALRRPRYPERLMAEPGETAVRALERSEPSLDALATFAQGLTPTQARSLGPEGLVMELSNAAVEDRVPVLRLWAALTPAERRRAFGEDGLRLAGLRGEASRRALDFLGQVGGEESPDDALVRYLLPGAPPFPGDLVLAAEARDAMVSFEPPDFRRTVGPMRERPVSVRRSYVGFVVTVQDAERGYMVFDFPVRPLK